MDIKERIKHIQQSLAEAEKVVRDWHVLLAEADGDIQNHVYESLEQAENFLMNGFENQAFEDCEGANNCGEKEYSQDFIVDGVEYTATGIFTYDRHSKTYYYIDESEYCYWEKV